MHKHINAQTYIQTHTHIHYLKEKKNYIWVVHPTSPKYLNVFFFQFHAQRFFKIIYFSQSKGIILTSKLYQHYILLKIVISLTKIDVLESPLNFYIYIYKVRLYIVLCFDKSLPLYISSGNELGFIRSTVPFNKHQSTQNYK